MPRSVVVVGDANLSLALVYRWGTGQHPVPGRGFDTVYAKEVDGVRVQLENHLAIEVQRWMQLANADAVLICVREDGAAAEGIAEVKQA